MTIPVLTAPVISTNTVGVATIDVSEPTSWSVGDYCLVALSDSSHLTGTASWDATSDPTGWTFLGEVGDGTSDTHLGVFGKILATGDFTGGTETFTDLFVNASNNIVSYTFKLTSVNATPIDVSPIGSTIAGTSIAVASITTGLADCLVLAISAADSGNEPVCQTTNSFVYGGQTSHTTGSGASLGYGTKEMATAGASGNCTFTISSSDGITGLLLSISGVTGGDTTAPTITTRTINAAGTTLTLGADESITAGTGGNGGMTLSTGQTLTYSSGDGTASIVYSISPTIGAGTTTLSYTQPTDGWEDAAGNDLATFSAVAITNNSTADVTDPTLSAHTNTITKVASTPGATSNESGTADMCLYLTSEVTPPTESEVLAGTYANMVGEQINLAVTAATPFSFTQVTGLTGNTAYTVDIYASDTAGNVSTLQRTNFTTQSATLTISTNAISATLDIVLFDGAIDTVPAILVALENATSDGSGNLVFDLNAASVTDSQAIEGIAKDTTSGDPIPLQGSVSIA